MADPFAAQLSAFKKSLKSTTDLPQQKRVVNSPTPQSHNTQISQSSSSLSLKRPESSDSKDSSIKRIKVLSGTDGVSEKLVNESDDDSKAANGAGSVAEATKRTAAAQAAAASGQDNLTMKLMSSSDYIKSKDRDVPIFELETSLGFKVDNQLIKCLSNVDRIQYNPESSSFQYLSLHNIKTGEDLLRVLRNQPAYAGLSVKQLKDGWNNCLTTISKLEKENEIIVHKTKKDNSPRHIWLNFDKLPIRVYNGVQNIQNWEIITGQVPALSQNNTDGLNNKPKSLDMIFYEMWNAVNIPQHDDLVKLLLDNGLKPTNAEPESMKSKKITSVQERKQKKPRRGKVTNLHMKGILKDYSSKFK
ncbi:hypothetical protein C6P40_004323 [Pichia californica]|uniref:TFIIE beta domain-containing protein n=1 Tax=Pichia californica TaxID=460514 RepID=A0A9P7BHT1_9ASCO|nr:hypothetical protein C6P42_000182 [[Candida] californica]KAG0689853.1 hypothetical protein C6P40_004323 [[Candida] californica]